MDTSTVGFFIHVGFGGGECLESVDKGGGGVHEGRITRHGAHMFYRD